MFTLSFLTSRRVANSVPTAIRHPNNSSRELGGGESLKGRGGLAGRAIVSRRSSCPESRENERPGRGLGPALRTTRLRRAAYGAGQSRTEALRGVIPMIKIVRCRKPILTEPGEMYLGSITVDGLTYAYASDPTLCGV